MTFVNYKTSLMGFFLGLTACSILGPRNAVTPGASERSPASLILHQDLNPMTGKDFATELNGAYEHLPYRTKCCEKNEVFVRWIRSRPLPTIANLMKMDAAVKLSLTKEKTARPVYVVTMPHHIIELFQAKDAFFYPESLLPHSIVLGATTEIKSSLALLLIEQIQSFSKNKLTEIVQATAMQTLDEEMYIGKNFDGKIFGRLEVVNRYARLIPLRVLENHIGLSSFSQKDLVKMSRAFQSQVIFNAFEHNQFIKDTAKDSYEKVENYVDGLLAGNIVPKNGTVISNFVESARQKNLLKQVDTKTKAELVRIMTSLIDVIEQAQTPVSIAVDQLIGYGSIDQAQEMLNQNSSSASMLINSTLQVATNQPYRFVIARREIKLDEKTTIPPSALVALGLQSQVLPTQRGLFLKSMQDVQQAMFAQRQLMSDAARLISEVSLATLLKNIAPRRAEAFFGQLDYRYRTESSLASEKYAYNFPELMHIEFDYAALRNRDEIPDKGYPYEIYLNDFDRVTYRECLGSFKEPQNKDELATDLKGGFGKVWRQKYEIYDNYGLSSKNLDRDNVHLLYCRLPRAYRSCLKADHDLLMNKSAEAVKKHREGYSKCQSELHPDEQMFYKAIFFNEPLQLQNLSREKMQRPDDPRLWFEDEVLFHDRYRARESMMNPAGLNLDPLDLLFYVRLNIEFRSCLGVPVILHKVTGGKEMTKSIIKKITNIEPLTKEQAYEHCKNGVPNEENFRYEGRLTLREKYLYEKIMLKRDVTYEQVVQKEMNEERERLK